MQITVLMQITVPSPCMSAALSGPERLSGIESPREALRLGTAARAPKQREQSGVLIADEQSAVAQARAAECSGMARVGAARASAQQLADAAALMAASLGQRQPERGHSSFLFQFGTLGGRPVAWREETTNVRRHSPEHGFLRDVVELAHLCGALVSPRVGALGFGSHRVGFAVWSRYKVLHTPMHGVHPD